MASDRKFDEKISAWFDETAPAALPQHVLSATFERTRRTRQQLGWRGVLGRLQMPRFIPAIGGAAVVVMFTVLALALVPGNLGPAATGSPSPAPSPSPSASPSHAAVQTPDQWGCVNLGAGGGDFRTSVGTISVTATVPDGWYGGREGFSIANAPCLFDASFGLEINPVGTVYSDACHWQSSVIAAATPAAVIAALAAQKGPETTGPTDTIVGGYPASRFDLTIPAGFDLEPCDDDELRLVDAGSSREAFGRTPGQGEGMILYVVDVDGGAVGVSACCSNEATTPAEIAEVDAIIASMRFAP